MSSAPVTLALAPIKTIDPGIKANSQTILDSDDKFKALRSKLAAEFEAAVLKLAETHITNADVANFRFDDFTARWTDLRDRFQKQRDALETFRLVLAQALSTYISQHKDALIAAFTETVVTQEQQYQKQSEANAENLAKLKKLKELLAELQSYDDYSKKPSDPDQTGAFKYSSGPTQSDQTSSDQNLITPETKQTAWRKRAAILKTRVRAASSETTQATQTAATRKGVRPSSRRQKNTSKKVRPKAKK